MDLVQIENGKPMTTSLLVAEKFGKRHDKVLRAIKDLECSEEFNRLNFGEIEFLDPRGRKQPAHRTTREDSTEWWSPLLNAGLFGGIQPAQLPAQRSNQRKIA